MKKLEEVELGKMYGVVIKEKMKQTTLKGKAIEITKNGYIKLEVNEILNFFNGEYESGWLSEGNDKKYLCFNKKSLIKCK